MALVKNVEKRIYDIEGFEVDIKQNGRNMRDDRDIPMYPAYERMARNSMTVEEWKNRRFRPNYAGLDVDVKNGNGDAVAGQTQLGTVRDSYAVED